jgi:hypothetical protein
MRCLPTAGRAGSSGERFWRRKVNINFLPLIVAWGVLAAAVIVLIAVRKSVARGEDEQLHVMNTAAVGNQIAVAHKLEVIDKWGKIVTAVTIAFGLLLAGLFVYQTWTQSATTIIGA